MMKFSACFYWIFLGVFGLVTLQDNAAQMHNEPLRFDAFQYRNLGAFRISAWVGDIAVPENPGAAHRHTWYVVPRAGGVWKTVNNGTTFFCISDTMGTSSMGDVEVAPSNPDILWVGTGEDFNARSSYYGNGIWKSTNAGETWSFMGLEDSHHISKIIIHPDNPDIVWVAVMGHLYSQNEERGVFKTVNGGATWDKILYVDEATGFIDMVGHPSDPDILYACSYEKIRTPWTYEPGGEKSRIYKTSDGGLSWEKLKGGLPGGHLGRIGIDIHRSNPDILVAVIQNLNLKPGADPKAEVPFDEFTDHSFDNLIGGEVYRSMNAGVSWDRINDPEEIDVSGKAAYSFNKIYIDPIDPDKIYIIGVGQYYTLDGGKTWPSFREQDRFRSNFGDNRTFWIDPKEPRHMMLGSDGGIYETWDGGKTMNHYYQLPLGEIYMVEVDDAEPYNIYIGLQDHEVWKGPSNSWSGQISIKDWVIVGMWDGMHCKVDHSDNRWLYFTTQFGKHHRVDQSLGERVEITPKAPEGEDFYRYTWNTPVMLSPHDSKVIYTGGQKLLRSNDRGNTWEVISPDLTDNDKEKIAGTGHIMYCTITTISESPVEKGVIWVGTDDGHIHLTRNGGHTWEERTDRITALGVPADRWVSRVVTSGFEAGTAYVTKCGYRNDDFKPYVFKTSDYGQSWEDISSNLPDYPVNVIFEDQKNKDLLFVGNDIGVYVSLNGGQSWAPLKANMPPVVVRDLLVHPRENDLVVGTYGRAAWITDISPLQQFTSEIQQSEFHLFNIEPKPRMNFSQQAYWGNYHMTGSNHWNVHNEQNGLEIWYYFKEAADEKATLLVIDDRGETVFEDTINVKPGIHKMYWDTMRAEPGSYTLQLTWRGQTLSKEGVVKERWIWPVMHYR